MTRFFILYEATALNVFIHSNTFQITPEFPYLIAYK